MSTLNKRPTLGDEEFKIINVKQVGRNRFLITTVSKAFGQVTQNVTVVPSEAATINRSSAGNVLTLHE